MDEELLRRGGITENEDQLEDEFLAKLADAETPLYPTCTSHSKLSAIVSLFRIKTENGWSNKSFNELLEALPGMLPEGNVLHTSMYDVKKFLKSFDIGYQKIHACVNDCCLFRKKYKHLENCPKCKTSRWKINSQSGEVKKGVPQKVLRYFPLIPRLKRIIRSPETANQLRWHFNNKSNDGKMRHPVDSVTWEQMNERFNKRMALLVRSLEKEEANKFLTCSRKGMVRLAEEMKQETSYPLEVTRLKVWVKSRIKKDGTAVNTRAAAKINEAAHIEKQSASLTNPKSDHLSQLLGPDNPGRLRAMGRGMSMSKLACFNMKNKTMIQMQENQVNLLKEVDTLKAEIAQLKKPVDQRQGTEVGENSCGRSVNRRALAKCLLLDWSGSDEIVAEGRVLSSEPTDLVNGVALGPEMVKVLVEKSTKGDAFLWRPAINMSIIEEAVGEMIPWPDEYCVLSDNGVHDNEELIEVTSMPKCKLMGWSKGSEIVAEGRFQSRDRNILVNGLPLGPNAVKVIVDVVLQPHYFLWRPTTDMTLLEDSLNSSVAWPESKVIFETTPYASLATPHSLIAPLPSPIAPTKKAKTIGQSPTRQSPRKNQVLIDENQKCKLYDLTRKNQVVAEGCWASNNPEHLVHHVPLGQDAVKVWVDVVKVPDAAVWRHSTEIESMADALGTCLAWPKDKVTIL